jgi:hypothetical protein
LRGTVFCKHNTMVSFIMTLIESLFKVFVDLRSSMRTLHYSINNAFEGKIFLYII